jgi:Ca2+-binding EF-hand superfamily protein
MWTLHLTAPARAALLGGVLLAGGALVLLSRGPAFAQPQPKDEQKKDWVQETFTRLDANRDGKLTADELTDAGKFKACDANADGAVTLEELRAAVEKMAPKPNPAADAEKKFKELDKNADGKLSAEEIGKPELFTALDKNADGAVTLDEVKAHLAAQGGKPGDKPADPAAAAAKMKAHDKNGDGKLSAEEVGNPELFKALDANADGGVTLDELQAFMGKHQDKPGQPNKGGDPAADAAAKFKNADKNGDGKLTAEEVGNPEFFKALDKNGDGAVTLDEVKAHLAAQGGKPGDKPADPAAAAAAKLKALDKNGDGKLSVEEVGNPELFKALDANADGGVTLDELQAFMAKHQDKPAGKPGNDAEAKMKAYDKNGDGKLSADEVGNAELFAKLDANGDGGVTLDELKAFLANPPKK